MEAFYDSLRRQRMALEESEATCFTIDFPNVRLRTSQVKGLAFQLQQCADKIGCLVLHSCAFEDPNEANHVLQDLLRNGMEELREIEFYYHQGSGMTLADFDRLVGSRRRKNLDTLRIIRSYRQLSIQHPHSGSIPGGSLLSRSGSFLGLPSTLQELNLHYICDSEVAPITRVLSSLNLQRIRLGLLEPSGQSLRLIFDFLHGFDHLRELCLITWGLKESLCPRAMKNLCKVLSHKTLQVLQLQSLFSNTPGILSTNTLDMENFASSLRGSSLRTLQLFGHFGLTENHVKTIAKAVGDEQSSLRSLAISQSALSISLKGWNEIAQHLSKSDTLSRVHFSVDDAHILDYQGRLSLETPLLETIVHGLHNNTSITYAVLNSKEVQITSQKNKLLRALTQRNKNLFLARNALPSGSFPDALLPYALFKLGKDERSAVYSAVQNFSGRWKPTEMPTENGEKSHLQQQLQLRWQRLLLSAFFFVVWLLLTSHSTFPVFAVLRGKESKALVLLNAS